MATSKRERELARQKQQRKAEQQAEATERRRRNRIVGGVILAAALVVGGGFFIANALAEPSDTDAAAASATPANAAGCEDVPDPQGSAKQFPDGPEGITLTDAVYGLTLKTTCGDVEVELDTKNAPKNAASLIFLANTGASVYKVPGDKNSGIIENQGYFDNAPCHRLTTGTFNLLQCGDPTGTGTAGPGYSTPDEGLPPDLKKAGPDQVTYPRGVVAMANSGPDSNGSQFFIVYKDTPLPPDYVVVGKVTKGLAVIDKVAQAGVTGGTTDGAPAQPISLTKVTSFETREVGTP